MATLLSVQSGNLTTNTTWGVVDNTSFLDSVVSVYVPTTSLVQSNTFIPGAITVSGIALQLAYRFQVPSGTFTVQLFNFTTTTAIATVTVNVSDIPNTYSVTSGRGLGWVYFKFASNVTLVAGQSYSVRTSTSASNQLGIYVSVAAGFNYSRALVTSTNAAPAATDVLIITGSNTGAGTSSSVTVTMDSTSSATVYGTVYIGNLGTLSYGTSAATNYILRIAGNMFVGRGGELRVGNSSTPIPDNSTARLEFNVTSNGQFGLTIHGGTLTTYGMVKTNSVLLNADAAAAATSITLSSVPTGWVTNDQIGIASTTITSTQAEVKGLTANVTTTAASIAALTNAHGGNSTTSVQADVINLTRNVVITVGATTTLVTYVAINGYGTNVNCRYTQFLQCGSTTASTSAISIWNAASSQANTIDIQYCSIYQTTTVASGLGYYLGNTLVQTTENSSVTFSNNSIYGISASPVTVFPNTATPSGSTWENNVIMRNGSAAVVDWRGANTNNSFNSSSGTAVNLAVYGAASGQGLASGSNNAFSGLKAYANTGSGVLVNLNTGFAFTSPSYYNFPNFKVWRNSNGIGVQISSFEMGHPQSQLTFTNGYFFGNVSFNVLTSTQQKTIFESCYFWSGTTTVTQYAFANANNSMPTFNETTYFNNCVFGRDNLGNVSNFTAAIIFGAAVRSGGYLIVNPTFSGTIIAKNASYRTWAYNQGVTVFRENGVLNSNSLYSNCGTLSTDTSIFFSTGPSIRITPAATSQKFGTSTARIPLAAGQTATIQVRVRLSTSGDGSAYTGSAPTLVYRYNPIGGVSTDTVVATHSGTTGVWETLTYNIPAPTYDSVAEFYVDCDGTSGWVNVDDFYCSTTQNPRGGKFWNIEMGNYLQPVVTTRSTTFVS